MSNVMTVDFSSIAQAIPALLVIGGIGALIVLAFQWFTKGKSYSATEISRAAGLSSEASIIADLRALAQKVKDKTREAEEKGKEADKANETVAKLVAAVANLSAKPAGNANEALTTLESLAVVSSTTLDSMTGQAPSFRDAIEDVRATGRVVKGILDVPEKLTNRFTIEKNKLDEAVNAKNRAETEAANAKTDLERANARITQLEDSVEKYRKLAEGGRLTDLKKLAKLEGRVEHAAELTEQGKSHNAQVIDLAKAAIATKAPANNQQGGNRGGNNRNGNNQPQNPTPANT